MTRLKLPTFLTFVIYIVCCQHQPHVGSMQKNTNIKTNYSWIFDDGVLQSILLIIGKHFELYFDISNLKCYWQFRVHTIWLTCVKLVETESHCIRLTCCYNTPTNCTLPACLNCKLRWSGNEIQNIVFLPTTMMVFNNLCNDDIRCKLVFFRQVTKLINTIIREN